MKCSFNTENCSLGNVGNIVIMVNDYNFIN